MVCNIAPIALQFLHSYRRLTVLPVLVCLPCLQKIFNPEIAQSIYFVCLLNTCFYSPDRVEWLCRTSTDRFILLTTVLGCAIHKLFFSTSVSVILCMVWRAALGSLQRPCNYWMRSSLPFSPEQRLFLLPSHLESRRNGRIFRTAKILKADSAWRWLLKVSEAASLACRTCAERGWIIYWLCLSVHC